MSERPSPLPAFADRPPAAVTFDFWDTLVRADTRATRAVRKAAVLDALAAADRTADEAVLDAAMADAAHQFSEAWHANRRFTAEDGAMVVIRALELEGEHDLAESVLVAFARAADGIATELTPGVADVLAGLDDAGVRLGIICDVGMTPSYVLRSYLDGHGVLDRFAHWSFSDEVGVFKPDPTIFEHALAGLEVGDPTRVAHVGDLLRTDVAGARGMGMVAVRYAGITDDAAPAPEGGPEADPGEVIEAHAVASHHDDLLALLGLG